MLVQHFFFTSGEQLPEIARNIDALKPDAIMSLGTHTTGAMLAGTHNISIVFAAVTDPIASGYANSLARPGGMATGVSLMASEIAGKRVQFLQELIPDITRIAVFTNPANSSGLITSAQIEAAGGILGVQVRVVEAQGSFRRRRGLGCGCGRLGGRRRQGARVCRRLYLYEERIADLSAKHQLALMYDYRQMVEAGGLVSYGVNLAAHYFRSAYFVDRILKGAKTTDLPVEQPTVFDFIINLKTARELGIIVPPKLMIFATELIE